MFKGIGIFIAIIFVIAIVNLINTVRLYFKGRALIKNPSDSLVEEYVNQLSFVILKNHPDTWGRLRDIVYKVNGSSKVSSKMKEKLYNKVKRKGCRLDGIKLNRETSEEKIKRSGAKGEERVNYSLKWLSDEYKVLSNVRLKSRVESQEFDNIVIGPNGIFHIETKNYGGDYGCKIRIDKSGNWIKVINEKETGIDSPEFQLNRHQKVLEENIEKYFNKEYTIRGIVVLSNEKTVIEGSENSDVPIVKADLLPKYIEKFTSLDNLNKEEVQKIYLKLESI